MGVKVEALQVWMRVHNVFTVDRVLGSLYGWDVWGSLVRVFGKVWALTACRVSGSLCSVLEIFRVWLFVRSQYSRMAKGPRVGQRRVGWGHESRGDLRKGQGTLKPHKKLIILQRTKLNSSRAGPHQMTSGMFL